jgi:hypothetical protein
MWEMDLHIHSFLNLELDRGEGPAPIQEPLYPMKKKVVLIKSQPGSSEKEKWLSLLRPRLFSPWLDHYIDQRTQLPQS